LTISKQGREIEGYKREIKEKDSSYKKLEEKLEAFIEEKNKDEEKVAREIELGNLKNVSSNKIFYILKIKI